jgi:hypothetical protein
MLAISADSSLGSLTGADSSGPPDDTFLRAPAGGFPSLVSAAPATLASYPQCEYLMALAGGGSVIPARGNT